MLFNVVVELLFSLFSNALRVYNYQSMHALYIFSTHLDPGKMMGQQAQ